jgi:hypothetical protein
MNLEFPEAVKKQFSKQDWRKIASLEWSKDDWADFYHCISFALWRIARRHAREKLPKALDYQI